MTASNPEPVEAEEEVSAERDMAPGPVLKEVDNNISPLRHAPDPCSTCG